MFAVDADFENSINFLLDIFFSVAAKWPNQFPREFLELTEISL